MPELPEVETLCRQLQEKIAGAEIHSVEFWDQKFDPIENLAGRFIREVRRSGKRIQMVLNDKRIIVIHLRMTGRLFWQKEEKKPIHCRWRMTFAEGSIDLIDPRRFATIEAATLLESEDDKDLGKKFDRKSFLEHQAIKRVPVKSLLMNPKAIAGIGNIYACEILYQSGISPLRPAEDIKIKEWDKIFTKAKKILKRGIQKRGTSISDWRDLYGCKGEYQHELKVYGREGKNCSNCGGDILRIRQNGRSTFYCPHCQT